MAEGAPGPFQPAPARWMDPPMGQGLPGPWTPRWAGPGPRPGLSTCLDPSLGPAGRSAAPHQSPRPSDSLMINSLQRFPRPGLRLCSRSIPNVPGPRHSSAGGAAWGHRGATGASRCRRAAARNVPRAAPRCSPAGSEDGAERGPAGPAALPRGRGCSRAVLKALSREESPARCPQREEAAGDGLSSSETRDIKATHGPSTAFRVFLCGSLRLGRQGSG